MLGTNNSNRNAPPAIGQGRMSADDSRSPMRAVPLPGTAGVALTDLSPMRLEQLQDAWRSRRRLSEPTIASFDSHTARKEQVQRHMVTDYLGGGGLAVCGTMYDSSCVALTDVTPKEFTDMSTIWDAKRADAPAGEEEAEN